MFLLLVIDAYYKKIVMMDSSLYDARWTGPLTCQISGQSGCGKTWFMKQFLKHHKQLVKPAFTKKLVLLRVASSLSVKRGKCRVFEGYKFGYCQS